MESFLRVDSHAGTSSPSGSFNTDNADASSICPLINPSPPTNALVDPLPEPPQTGAFQMGDELAEKLQKVHEIQDAESISSASSSEQPVTSQLLDGSSFLNMPNDAEAEPEGGKLTPLELTFRNPTEDYFFMCWNWPLIRKFSLYLYVSVIIGMVGLVTGLISTLPKTCHPPTQWYQGKLFYEIFPASFHSSNQEMEGNLKGISLKADYIMKLGVRGVRLNSIFRSPHYPEDFENATTLTEIDGVLGTLEDLKGLVKHLTSRNMSLVLDLPVFPFIQKSFQKTLPITGIALKNASEEPSDFFSYSYESDPIEEAMQYWLLHGVEGFYLKGLEKYGDNFDTARLLKRWKKLLGPHRILIVQDEVVSLTPKENLQVVLENVDLVDVKLNLERGVSEVIAQIDSVQNSSLFAKPGAPWVHWSIGNVNSNRLANVLAFGNATLGATLLQMMLPGTPSIFYGDEIGLHQIPDPDDERQDIRHLHQLTMMPWQDELGKGKKSLVQPWIYGGEPTAHFDQVHAVIKMVELRAKSPSIYMNAVYKQGVNKANAEVKYTQENFLVIQRWYPRRKSYVVASNLGNSKISADLSLLLYSGQVIVGPRVDSMSESISFKEVNLWPGESVVIVLD
ncbi:amino acid transporter heavy chain SLC3A1-like [Euwallacea similis]|uniref:amino acid transporter heavy chain SLC3A1-like n=1 Tax=Euwallacea similis TaxID=1736056 RepID=UPI00344F579A